MRTALLLVFAILFPACNDSSSDRPGPTPVFSGIFLTSDVLVDSGPSGDATTPRIACSGAHVYAVWTDDRNGNSTIFWSRSTDSGLTWTLDARVDQGSGTMADQPVIAVAGGNVWIVWRDDRDGDPDVFARIYDTSGAPLGDDFRVDQDAGTSAQEVPAIAASATRVWITWRDQRNGNDDIYARVLDESGIAIGNDFRVDQDPGASAQSLPVVALSGSHSYFAWQDHRNGGDDDIYVRIYDSAAAPLGNDFRIDQQPAFSNAGAPAIAAFANLMAVAWQDDRSGNSDIYARITDRDGVPLSDDFRVDQGIGTSAADSPAIAMVDQNIWIVWRDHRNGDTDLFMRWYDKGDMNPAANDFRVDGEPGAVPLETPALCASGATVTTVWSDDRDGDFDVWGNVSRPQD